MDALASYTRASRACARFLVRNDLTHTPARTQAHLVRALTPLVEQQAKAIDLPPSATSEVIVCRVPTLHRWEVLRHVVVVDMILRLARQQWHMRHP